LTVKTCCAIEQIILFYAGMASITDDRTPENRVIAVVAFSNVVAISYTSMLDYLSQVQQM
jgi:hypothetical protein